MFLPRVLVPLMLLSWPVATDLWAQDVSPMFGERASRRAAYRDAEVNAAVRGGIAWLLGHQDSKGFWDCDEFMKSDPAGQKCTGAGNPAYDVGVTALALLALLAQADSVHDGAMHRAADWLVDQQARDSGLFDTAAVDFIYGQAIGTLALVEAAAVLGHGRYRRAATAGLRSLQAHHNPGKGWRYQPRDGQSDTSVTAWCVAAYCAAHHAGIETRAETVGEAMAWLEGVTNVQTGHSGYSARGEGSAREPGDHGRRFPVEKTEVMTAVAMYTRALAGFSTDSRINRAAAEVVLAKVPQAGAVADFYFWLQGSEAMAAFAGRSEARKWFKGVHDALLPTQREDGAARGSWDPLGPWGHRGGRVYATAVGVLALSSPYRLDVGNPAMVVPDAPPFRRVHYEWKKGAVGRTLEALDAIPAAEAVGHEPVIRRVRWFATVQTHYVGQVRLQADALFPEPVDRHTRLDELAERYADLPAGSELRDAAAAMLKDPDLRDEIESTRMLRDILARFDTRKPPKSASKRSSLRKRFEHLVKKYSRTSAAETANKWVMYFR